MAAIGEPSRERHSVSYRCGHNKPHAERDSNGHRHADASYTVGASDSTVSAFAITAVKMLNGTTYRRNRHWIMTKVTYTSSTDVYKFSANGYSLTNNVWYPNLVDGINYRTSVTFNPTDVQIGANFSWTLPSNGGGTLAMPEIIFDTRAAGVSTTQVGNIAALSVNYTANLSNLKVLVWRLIYGLLVRRMAHGRQLPMRS